MRQKKPHIALMLALFIISFNLVSFELLLTRIFGVVLFAQFAHLALALALLGISIGAMFQHLWPNLVPDQGLDRRMAWLCLIQVGLTLVAVWATLNAPLTVQFEVPPNNYGERSHIKDNLLDMQWFLLLLPVLASPFCAAGLAFAGAFQRRRNIIGQLYGADLIGGAFGAILFIPLLHHLAGPDVVFVQCIAGAFASAVLFHSAKARWQSIASVALCCAALTITMVGIFRGDVLQVQFAAGYAEENLTHSEWTALTRISIHESKKRGALIVLDNASASEVFQSRAKQEKIAKTVANRSLVYRFHEPPARVAILAASAGPEVSVAQYYGYTQIEAIDVAGEIFSMVAERFPNSPVNPYLVGDTVRVKSDGRAAIMQAEEPYDIIHMVHANLHSSAGLLANAWSPALLETKEAFTTYLDHLSEDGTIAFGRGQETDAIARSAAGALRERGVKEPWTHIFYSRADTALLMVKKRPWTQEERDKAWGLVQTYRNPKMVIDPTAPFNNKTLRVLSSGPLLTDDRPYLDERDMVTSRFEKYVQRAQKISGSDAFPLAVLYRSFFFQALFVLLAGFVFLFIPFLRRGPTQLKGLNGVSAGLGYVACLGYGYLAIETILIHELALFVGHPTYAVSVTILSMLLFSGLGSIWSATIADDRRIVTLQRVLGLIVGLGLLQAFVVPTLLVTHALQYSLFVRLCLTFVLLAPLGFVMGIPFPLAMRVLSNRAGGLVPWAWSLNGWMSVVASLVTILISRTRGYSYAFGVALGAYLLALWLVPRLPKIGSAHTTPKAGQASNS